MTSGFIALAKGEWEEAERAFQTILQRDPAHAEANRGMAEMALAAGYPEDALAFAASAAGADDDRLALLRYRALRDLGREAEAVDEAGVFLQRHPAAHELRARLCEDLYRSRRFEDVMEIAGAGRALQPERIQWSQFEAGAALATNRAADAEAALRRCWKAADPRGSERLGRLLLNQGRLVEAAHIFGTASARHPEDVRLLAGKASACQRLGRMDECRAAVEKQVELRPSDPQVFGHWIGLHVGKPEATAADLNDLVEEWDRRFGVPPNPLPALEWVERKPEEPLRVGFLSSTFRHHANCQFLLPLLDALKPSKHRLFAYHDAAFEDDVTDRCRAAVSVFRSLEGTTVRQAAEVIRADALDVLVEINSYFDGGRPEILSYRPTPVQVHYLGGAGATGLKSVDWRLSDDLIEPEDQACPEKGRVFRLAGGIHAFRPLREAAAVGVSPSMERGFVTFGCLNSLTKIEPPVLRLWSACLAAVPGSRLRLVKEAFLDEATREDFRRRAAEAGIDPRRLDLAPADLVDFDALSVYRGIDIALDSFPYNGITTTCEALWMGVPVVTLRGDRFVSREAAAILTRIGREEWVADSAADYVRIAQHLADNPRDLAEVRAVLRSEFLGSPVADGERLAREFEGFLQHAVSMQA